MAVLSASPRSDQFAAKANECCVANSRNRTTPLRPPLLPLLQCAASPRWACRFESPPFTHYSPIDRSRAAKL